MEVKELNRPDICDKSVAGFYCRGKYNYFGFFYFDYKWYFFVGSDVIIFGNIDRVDRSYSGIKDAELHLTLKSGDSLVIPYYIGGGIKGDPTPFVDDEDFDFGLFFDNVVANEERLSRMAQV